MRIEVNLMLIKRTILSNIIKHYEIVNFPKLRKNDHNDLFFSFFFLLIIRKRNNNIRMTYKQMKYCKNTILQHIIIQQNTDFTNEFTYEISILQLRNTLRRCNKMPGKCCASNDHLN